MTSPVIRQCIDRIRLHPRPSHSGRGAPVCIAVGTVIPSCWHCQPMSVDFSMEPLPMEKPIGLALSQHPFGGILESKHGTRTEFEHARRG
ncbi:hypothetical protein Veis_3687 [Verminephrobacter eiseniae EF01-2]|uniref:Uncharacterized protein n=1 Tax=Verminephrobacter eiseniae (strain EF01-2) TaxID=391735 RepID=A1WP46_VEREI|nr:hypothetical protein Veis_3687 [Verminephrobacter eiseniae EF01-2]